VKPRHVGINAVFLRPGMGGLETYTKELIPALVEARPDLRVSLFLSPQGVPAVRGERWLSDVRVITHPLLGGPGMRALSETTVLGALAPRRGVDVLHSVALTAPLRTRSANVITLADVTWLVAPDPADRWSFLVWRALVPPVARRADRLIAISHDGAARVVEHLRVRRERVDVVYLGAGLEPVETPTPAAELRARLGLGSGPVIMTLAAKRRHKNLGRLVEAMAGVRARHPDAVLVLPGNPTPHEAWLRDRVADLGLQDAVRFPAYLEEADVEGLYAVAACFVFASLYEGFGLPVLEAQRRGVPVACSNASSVPEAAGPGARLFDPRDVGDIGAAILELLEDPELARRLVAAGREHQARFTWRRSAEAHLESYERALAARR
jgi:glycosyltransferase involved in cell wall biosynthesis